MQSKIRTLSNELNTQTKNAREPWVRLCGSSRTERNDCLDGHYCVFVGSVG